MRWLFGSTSPSYLILQSLDAANAILAVSFREKLDICRWRLGMLCRELDALRPGLALPLTGAHREPLKLTLDAAALGLSGQQLAQALRERGVECEYADPRYVVLMPSAESSAAEFACLQTALHAICDEALLPMSPLRLTILPLSRHWPGRSRHSPAASPSGKLSLHRRR